MEKWEKTMIENEKNFIKNFDRGKTYFYSVFAIDPQNFDPDFPEKKYMVDRVYKIYCYDDDKKNIYIELIGDKEYFIPNQYLSILFKSIHRGLYKNGYEKIIYENLEKI